MTYWETIRDTFANFRNFRGRMSRAAYGKWMLFAILTLGGVTWFAWSLDQQGMLHTPLVLGWVALWIVMLMATGAATGRRMQDAGISNLWLAILIFPFIGFIFVAGSVIRPSDPGPNQFGPPPTV